LCGVNQQPIVSDDSINAITVPNCTLYTGQDIYGNDVQALVPFGKDPDAVFATIEDWDGDRPEAGPVVFASTIRAVIGVV
jgi:hypothetical protein